MTTQQEAKVASVTRKIRNALIKAEREGKIAFAGPCGTYAACGAYFTNYTQVQGELFGGLTATTTSKLPQTSKCCPLCAFLLGKEVSKVEADLEGKVAELLEIEVADVVSFLQGFDGDTGEPQTAWFRAGRRLAKKFEKEEDSP